MVYDFLDNTGINSPDSFTQVDGICPRCGNKVIFASLRSCYDLVRSHHNGRKDVLGQRVCPDNECMAHIFFIKIIEPFGEGSIKIFPSKFPLKNLNVKKLPKEIRETLEETLDCYNNSCYRASAIMIRRTLEAICSMHSAKGPNLHERIKNLKAKITISEQLYDAIMELKFLGNDAAHIESEHFEKIGEVEVETALVLLIEILRALYEHQNLLDKFKALKKESNQVKNEK